MLKFSMILSLRTDFGITTTPLCVSQRRITCATVFLYFAAMESSNSFWKMLFLPSANGPRIRSEHCFLARISEAQFADRKDVFRSG
jgi:hypothetical protein